MMADSVGKEEVSEETNPVECDVCGQDHITEDCPMLGLSTSEFKAQISRARLTVPHYLGIIDYTDGGVGIIATEPISNKTQLGPFEAKKTCNITKDDIFVLKILSADGNTICLDSSSENHCNWMALVQIANSTEEQNCMAYQLGINIYFNTTKDIPAGAPLKVWYAWKYAQKLGKPIEPDGKTKSMLGLDISSWSSDVLSQGGSGANSDTLLDDTAYFSSVLPTSSTADIIETIIVKQESNCEGKLYRCSRCPQVFCTQSDFAIHLRGHLIPSCMQESRGGRQGRPWSRSGVIRPLGRRGPGRPRKVTPVKEPGEITLKVFGPPKRRGRPKKLPSVEMVPAVEEEAGAEPSQENVESGQKVVTEQTRLTEENNVSDDSHTKEQTVESELKTGKECLCSDADHYSEETESNREITITPENDDTGPVKSEGLQEKDSSQVGQSSTEASAEVAKIPRKRGRPPKNRNLEKGEIAPQLQSETLSESPDFSRRVQPRRMLKGKRTSTFRYPGESSSDEEEDSKGKNVLRQAIKSVEYSDDDFDQEVNLEAGELRKEDSQIAVQTEDGVFLSKAPVILFNEDTGKTQTLDPATVSLVTTEVDASGQKVVIIHSNASTVSTSTVVYAEGGDSQVIDTDSTSQSQSIEPPDAPQDGLAALVDAALSSQKIAGSLDEGRRGDGEDGNSDDPDWKGHGIRREISPRKRRPKRRKGDDPDLEHLEESVKIVEGPNGSKEFACGVCSKRFQQMKYLKMHLPAHTDKFLCNDCGRRFARHESLQKHICEDWLALVEKIESGEDGSIIFRCKECGRSFSHVDHARRHASMHRGTWACTKCQKTFPKRQMLLEHRCGQATDSGESAGEDSNPADMDIEGDFPCDICKQSFRNAKYLFRHMAMHTELFKCEACGKCYSRKDSLQRHVLKCCPELADDYSVYACDKCKKTFGTRLGLENHIINCGKSQCLHCRVAFFSEEDLAAHKCEGKVIDDAAGVQFPCKECGKTFASLAYLARHEASHHAAFECDICKKVFVRCEELTWHTPVCLGVSKIERDGVAVCDVCQTEFTNVKLFREHYQVHTHPYRCDRCGKRFIKVGTLHTHKCDNVVVGNPGEEEGIWQCEMCEKTFKNERYLARHKQLHGLPSFDCEYCGKKFIRKDYLNDHKCVLPDGTSVRVVRKKNRLYIRDDLVCAHCNKTFSSRSNLNKHVRVHGEKQAECHICGKKFHYESYLKLHVATVHDRQFQYQCSHCGKILFSKTGLIAHIKQFHQDTVKLYPCPKCGKTFRQKGNMRTHLYSHTKERTFKCQLCPKAFKYPDQLNRHRLEHTMRDKIKCSYCDKRFVRMSELRQHMRLFHSGVIYTCHICHESCAHKHTIVRHYRRKHPELAEVFDKQPDFLETLQKPAEKTIHLSTSSGAVHRLPIHLTAPSRDGEQKPRIIRVLADGQEQEYIISAAPSASENSQLDMGEESLPYATMTTEQAQDFLPQRVQCLPSVEPTSTAWEQEAVQALQDMSNALFQSADAPGIIQQTVEGPDGQQTVIILQVVGPDELRSMQEVAHMEGDQISVQEIAVDANELGIEVPMEISSETTDGVETISVAAGSSLQTTDMEPVVIDNTEMESVSEEAVTLVETVPGGTITLMKSAVVIDDTEMESVPEEAVTLVETVPGGTITLMKSAVGSSLVISNAIDTNTMVTSDMETVDTMETTPASSTVVTIDGHEQEVKYL